MLKVGTKAAALLLGAAMIVSACGKDAPVQNPAQGQTQGSGAGVSQTEKKQAVIKSYYGDENGEKLIEKTATIEYAKDEDKYLAALESLRKTSDPKAAALCSGFTFKSAKLQDGKLTVDLTISDDGHWGAPGEELTLQALKQTPFQFQEVQSLDILVDGKPADSLMGHMDLPHPIKRGS